MLTFSKLNQFSTKSQFVGVFIRQRSRFLGLLHRPNTDSVAINVGLLALFWWFWGLHICTAYPLRWFCIYIAKRYDVCMKTWKIIIKLPSRCHQNAGNRLQKLKFSWGVACPQIPPRRTRLRRVVCPRHTARLWHAKPPA